MPLCGAVSFLNEVFVADHKSVVAFGIKGHRGGRGGGKKVNESLETALTLQKVYTTTTTD